MATPLGQEATALLSCKPPLQRCRNSRKQPKIHQKRSNITPVAGSVVFTQLSITASGLSGVPLGLNWSVSGSISGNWSSGIATSIDQEATALFESQTALERIARSSQRTPETLNIAPVAGSVVFTQLSITASGLSGVPLTAD
jgi:hypothetical protein